ncbi:MAG: FimB/Mfa2 family fimbrial subunit [Tannerellaceae bacterium]|nr:FimB/Mfa2 family fimbrial subunit [Tannerellaceae bacterium]
MKTQRTYFSFLWRLTTLCTIALFTVSCVKEDLDDCPEELGYNLILYFEYLDWEGNNRYPSGNGIYPDESEIFATRIQTVDVLLYDASQKFYRWINCDNIIISSERMIQVLVDPGEYYIVGWANNSSHRNDYQSLFPSKTFNDSYVYHYGEKTADPLHYAPDMRGVPVRSPEDIAMYGVTVQPNEVTEHTLSFMSAHRTLNVYLRGFGEVDEENQENPVVTVSNLTSYYDNYLGRGVENVLFTVQSTQEIIYNQAIGDRENLGFASFYIPHFDQENSIKINITRPAMTIGYEEIEIPMTYVLEKLELTVADGDDLIIDVLIEYNGTYVEVKLPEWITDEVDGNFN